MQTTYDRVQPVSPRVLEYSLSMEKRPTLNKLDQETWLVPDPIGWLFGQNLDYFRPYKNQVETGCKGYPIQFIVNF